MTIEARENLHHHFHRTQDMVRGFCDAVRPPECIAPSVFAARYRVLSEKESDRPGLWRNDVFPYLASIMDAHAEALRRGKRGVVLMKSAQGGGSQAEINVLAWLQYSYPGPMLYLISKDDLARTFGKERFGYLLETCAPLARKALRRQLVQVKEFSDGKFVIQGGRSVLNLQSLPYRVVMIDEIDSLNQAIDNQGDLIKLARQRTASFSGHTLIVAFAHPTTKDAGAGKLYYEQSDQRRAFAACPHCGDRFWLSWKDVRVIPRDGLTKDQAARFPECYEYYTPCCGAQLSDGERYAMARDTRQESTLPADEAARRPWVGLHFSQLYMDKPLVELAREYIEGLDDEEKMRVFDNKTLGDCHEVKSSEATEDDWRRLIVIARSEDDPDAYVRGTVPPGVQFLTAGQDSRETQLHWAVWGWGLVETVAGLVVTCGWLVDCGIVEREKSKTVDPSELVVFDGLLYDHFFPVFQPGDTPRFFEVLQGGHDVGWSGSRNAVYEYCRRKRGRSIPVLGLATNEASTNPFLSWSAGAKWRGASGQEILDKKLKIARLNTHTLKRDLFGMVEKRYEPRDRAGDRRTRLTLPRDVPDRFLFEASAEYETVEKGKTVFKASHANHYSDCNIYAYALAKQRLIPMQHTFEFEARGGGARPKTLAEFYGRG